jgi:WhiB family redox-sensing transcriptional regulator
VNSRQPKAQHRLDPLAAQTENEMKSPCSCNLVVSSVSVGEIVVADAALGDVLAVAGGAARPRWMDRAACRGRPGRWWFTASTRRRAIRICQRCPVRDECLAYAIDYDEQYGVWGGLTAGERCAPRHGRFIGNGWSRTA